MYSTLSATTWPMQHSIGVNYLQLLKRLRVHSHNFFLAADMLSRFALIFALARMASSSLPDGSNANLRGGDTSTRNAQDGR